MSEYEPYDPNDPTKIPGNDKDDNEPDVQNSVFHFPKISDLDVPPASVTGIGAEEGNESLASTIPSEYEPYPYNPEDPRH